MPAHLLNRARHEREPWGVWLFARLAANSFRRASASLTRWWRLLRIQHSGVDRTRPWHDRLWLMIVTALTVFLALIFLAWLGRSLYVLIDRGKNATQWPFGFSPDRWCSAKGVECGALTGWVTSLLSIALASAAFLLWRLDRIRHRYLHLARRTPRELVPTAGTIVGKIVGRDQLCLAVMEDLRVRQSRRPHVLIGGVGTGKTAVIVQLTELLARRNAVPVPIRLRDTEGLDFMALAKKRFLEQIDDWMTSSAEAEKTWRRMHRDGRIVVLADGLEEALAGDPEKSEEGKPGERDTQIRNAIRDAHRRGLALLIASRPHSPLRGMDATIHELEPLSENDALSYIQEETPTEDDWRLSWIVEMAGATEAPLYLQITRELSRLDMLDRIARREDQLLQAGTQDRSSLRLRLLETWEEALIRGRLFPEVPLSAAERQVTLDWISALACAGLKMDSIEVSLETKLHDGVEQELQQLAKSAEAATPGWRGLSGIDRQLAASWGAQLGLIELGANRVRFQHSLIEAYLGSRLMDKALVDPEYLRDALYGEIASGHHTRPGREFLISLVLHSRECARTQVLGPSIASDGQPRRISGAQLCSWLLDAAAKHTNNKALDIYAAALEIAGAPDQPGTRQEYGPQAATQPAEADPGPAGPGPESGIGAALEDISLYWFSELTLIQALTLWALPEATGPLPASAADDDAAIPGRPRQNPDRTVERWLEIIADKPVIAHSGPKARPVHQLVDTAAELASRALAIQQPGRFLWMDENDAVSRIGAGQPKAAPHSARKPPLWIPPSAGWSALDPEAQQLLADVLVLLNLAERGEAPEDAEARLRQLNQHELPPCITRDRRPLEPLHTVGTAESHQPGSSCLYGCRFQLCPYPPKGLQHRRAELSEEFCRRQYRLARRYFKPGRHTARWQGMWAGRLRSFWLEMAERARNNAGGPSRPR